MFGAHYYIPKKSCMMKQLTSFESSPQDPTSVNTCATLPERYTNIRHRDHRLHSSWQAINYTLLNSNQECEQGYYTTLVDNTRS